jgi:hypothetical protein
MSRLEINKGKELSEINQLPVFAGEIHLAAASQTRTKISKYVTG